MKLKDFGQFKFIEHFAPQFLKGLPAGTVGIGDDCAVIPQADDQVLLVSTDALVENIHFIMEKISPEDLGYKSLAVNLSDIAAMGGTPYAVFLTLCLNENLELEWLDKFLNGLKQLAEEYSVNLLGGDTTASPGPFMINLTILGKMPAKQVKLRADARVGDIVCVTDYLGDSAGGLNLLLGNIRDESAEARNLVRQHLKPRISLTHSQWLAKHESVHAMIDVSDGIGSDAAHIVKQSKCGINIDIDKIPISTDLLQIAAKYKWDAIDLAAGGGEDYCLLLTVNPKYFEDLSHEFSKTFGSPLFRIGTVTEGSSLQYYKNGKLANFTPKGFDHFVQ